MGVLLDYDPIERTPMIEVIEHALVVQNSPTPVDALFLSRKTSAVDGNFPNHGNTSKEVASVYDVG
ncbi:hypothetical protein L873DRAFT_1809982 [Choiromyces venosus 120613-1]|uniref:Uncharacterized protein n=1 Tax=Choiromyces venosus 120613-1 TaxID=1336337 RepID=A0A3N4JG00_9PEZI|nr:hypothetical protein L873DRAFT_1809982 [Choiromyces venosus 120613-1]